MALIPRPQLAESSNNWISKICLLLVSTNGMDWEHGLQEIDKGPWTEKNNWSLKTCQLLFFTCGMYQSDVCQSMQDWSSKRCKQHCTNSKLSSPLLKRPKMKRNPTEVFLAYLNLLISTSKILMGIYNITFMQDHSHWKDLIHRPLSTMFPGKIALLERSISVLLLLRRTRVA